MTTLREAATQALDALEGGADSWQLVGPAIDALRAALVEDALQKFSDVNQELEAALGCEHCNQPLYAAVKCRVCGRVTSAKPVQEPVQDGKCKHCVDGCPACDARKLPVQEPFGYLWPTGRHPEFRFTQQKRDGVDGTPVYTSPPQRKPVEWDGRCMLGHCNSPAGCENSGECRAIERAHGIGGDK